MTVLTVTRGEKTRVPGASVASQRDCFQSSFDVTEQPDAHPTRLMWLIDGVERLFRSRVI